MKKLNILFIAIAAISMASCTKDRGPRTNTPANMPGQYASLETVLQNAAVKSQNKTVDAATGGSFYASGGTRFIFQPNAFRTLSGDNVTGNVDIEIREYLKRSDMIFSKVLPVSDGNPLVSGGEIYINATQNGQKVLLKDGMFMQANIPQGGTAAPGMEFFIGVPQEQNTANNVNWKPGQKDSTHNGFGMIVYNGDTLTLFSDSVGYCNADRFLSNPNYQHFKVNITGVTIPSGTSVSAIALYDNYNGLWPMTSITGNVVSEGHVPDIPVHFVVMTLINGHFYGGTAAVTPINDGNYTVNITEVDPATFKTQIDAL